MLFQKTLSILSRQNVRAATVWLAVCIVAGQVCGGKIVILARDFKSVAVPAVSLSIQNEGSGVPRRTLRDTDGVYLAAELPMGHHTLLFEAHGGDERTQQQVEVNVGGEIPVPFVWKVAF